MSQFATPPGSELTSLPSLTRRRVLAYLVDRATLALIGLAVALVFEPFIAWLHGYQLLLGWAAAAVYFGPFAMLLGNRTPGHNALGLEVVDAQGDKLSANRHMLRALLLATSALNIDVYLPSFGLLLTVAVTVLAVCQAIMLLWHGRQGRLLHDLIFNTHVRRSGEADLWIYTPLTARQERSVLGAVALVCALWGGTSWSFHGLDGPFLAALQRRYPLVTASWGPQHTTFYGAGKVASADAYVVTLSTYLPPTQAVAEDIACMALRDLPAAKRAAKLQVVVNQATRLGIITLNNGHSLAHAPSEWPSQPPCLP